MSLDLTARQARRIALTAQGFSTARPAQPVSRARLRKLFSQLGAIQIDSVNVLARAHYLPAFSRLGSYAQSDLEREAWGRKPSLFEYWGHAAALMPIETQPLFRWRMEDFGGRDHAFARQRRDYIDHVLAEIGRRGPVTGGDFADAPRKAGWWNWSDGKRALEWLFAAGLIAVKTRRGFERVYDLAERVIPPAVLNAPTPTRAESQRGLLAIAARAMGVADEGDLRDYFRMPVADTRLQIAEMAEAGDLIRARVEGWGRPAFMAPGAVARQPRLAALLSPFDNLIWRRERTERLLAARVRLEIYTPSHKREHGYYVLPFLMGEAITARVDLKSDRQAGLLRVQAAHLEPGADPAAVAPALAAELSAMAGWLGLGAVAVSGRGGLAPALRSAVG